MYKTSLSCQSARFWNQFVPDFVKSTIPAVTSASRPLYIVLGALKAHPRFVNIGPRPLVLSVRSVISLLTRAATGFLIYPGYHGVVVFWRAYFINPGGLYLLCSSHTPTCRNSNDSVWLHVHHACRKAAFLALDRGHMPIKEAGALGSGLGPKIAAALGPGPVPATILGLGAPASFMGIWPLLVLLPFAHSWFFQHLASICWAAPGYHRLGVSLANAWNKE